MYDWDKFWKTHRTSKAEAWLASERDQILDRWLDRLPAGKKEVIEVGCGGAASLKRLNRLRSDVNCHAIDSSPTAIDRLKGEIPGAVLGDCLNSPFGDREFDLIYSGGLMEHFPDETGFLREMRRILKDDGVMVTFVPARYSLWRLHQLLFFCLLGSGYEKSYTHPGLKALFSANGFETLELTGIDPFSVQGALMRAFNISFTPPFKTSPFKSAYTDLCIIARKAR